MEQVRQREVRSKNLREKLQLQQEERKHLEATPLEPRVVETKTGDVVRVMASRDRTVRADGGCGYESSGYGVFNGLRLEVVEKERSTTSGADKVEFVLRTKDGHEVHRFSPSEVRVVEEAGELGVAQALAERKETVEHDKDSVRVVCERQATESMVIFRFSRTEHRINAVLSGLRRLQEESRGAVLQDEDMD